MPIDYKQYPANWKTEIRPAVMQRAGEVREGNKITTEAACEECGAKNKSWIIRGTAAEFEYCADWLLAQQNSFGFYRTYNAGDGRIKVVLTVAHLDHDSANHNVQIDRLRAWCQRCHLNYDREHHRENFRKNRATKTGQQSLF